MSRGSILKNKTGINITDISVVHFNKGSKKNSLKKNKKIFFQRKECKNNKNSKKKNKTNMVEIDDRKENNGMDYELHAR